LAPGIIEGAAMEYYAGIDVSLGHSSVCVVDITGKIVREAKVASEPDALVRFFRQLEVRVTRIGLEAGPLSQGAACRAERGRVRHGFAGNAPCESSPLGDGGED
jgi:hypothetical protein